MFFFAAYYFKKKERGDQMKRKAVMYGVENINYVKTKEALSKKLEQYEIMTYSLSDDAIPILTTQYQLAFPSGVKRKSSPVEQLIEKREYYEKEIKKIMDAFNRLDTDERGYLYYRFIDSKKMCDDDVQVKLGLSYRYFSSKKRLAIIKFAISLGIVVYD